MKKAFSLIETIMVISIFSIIALVFVFTINNGTKNKTLLDRAQANIIYALETARSQAAAGIGSINGVKIEQDRFTILGSEPTILPSSISTDQTSLTIIFQRIDALPEIGSDAIIILRQESGIEKNITITKDGKIISD
ncbi:MAG: hypothetical protein A2V72_02315 [Candidatus Nealsonbacteria bacterium RBG_13_37_56]|uniref:General secretion pathway GspH domain-containing protein n=1 Tax=Candidatus Nealsonbacteria bacterium RBG_13_37_56 TaxID=1801661 RepID=A0A1G2DX73_9BACT|nr:MAG: hypothetical protein A2V72_02315 [Candidatus Nealsonbacteria bacterium RBG_13_37_56]